MHVIATEHNGLKKDGNDRCYLVLRDLIFQLRCLSTDGFRVDKVLLCGCEPLAQRF